MEPSSRSDEQKPQYPQSYAFVVQFEHPPGRDGRQPGRIEHILSGRAGSFETAFELMAFVAEVLAACATTDARAKIA